MKKILAFLLTTALILSIGTTVFAVKGGDGGFEGDVAYAFDSQETINSIDFFKTELIIQFAKYSSLILLFCISFSI